MFYFHLVLQLTIVTIVLLENKRMNIFSTWSRFQETNLVLIYPMFKLRVLSRLE